MKAKILDEFYALCLQAKHACEHLDSVSQFEPSLQRVLSHIKAHPSLRPEFTAVFLQMLENSSGGPWELIAFCMHDLRWSKIQEAAREKLLREEDHRVKTIMANVIDSFSDKWADAEIYKYYSKW